VRTPAHQAEPGCFLDDLGINLKPAKELGMTTIKVSSEDQAITELSDVLRIDFRV
jgi:putative hydrolase of the HAD superfamily